MASGIGVLIVQGLPPTQNDNAAPINPFSTVVVTDSDPTALTDATIVISPDADGTLSGGPVLDPIGGGVYEIGSVSPANLTADLESLTFTPTGTGTMTTISLSVNGGPALTTNIITPPSVPIITGIVATQLDDDTVINPFSGVTDTDADSGTTAAVITIGSGSLGAIMPTDDYGNFPTGISWLTKTGVGQYTIAAATPDAFTSDLDSLTFTPVVATTATTTIFALDVIDTEDGLSSFATTSITTPSGSSPNGLAVVDITLGGRQFGVGPALATEPPTPASQPDQTPYSGPVAGLDDQYINITPDNLNISVDTPNWFLHSGAGEDAIQAFGGTNVLDGGTGSNFLVGGTSTGEFDTFFVDDRAATADTWSTVVNFVSGDNATVWGITPAMFNITMVDGQGAVGANGVAYTGLTIHATPISAPSGLPASLTLSGYTSADLVSGKITETFGTDPPSGSPYMLIHADTCY